MSIRIIKCSVCGVFNTNKEVCENCGNLISDQKKREIKKQELKEKHIKEVVYKLENPSIAERLKKHPNIIYKIFLVGVGY